MYRRKALPLARRLWPACLWLMGCTETPSSFPPCLDPYDNFMNDCPALDAGADSDAEALPDASALPDAATRPEADAQSDATTPPDADEPALGSDAGPDGNPSDASPVSAGD